jgi:hypothetical protein
LLSPAFPLLFASTGTFLVSLSLWLSSPTLCLLASSPAHLLSLPLLVHAALAKFRQGVPVLCLPISVYPSHGLLQTEFFPLSVSSCPSLSFLPSSFALARHYPSQCLLLQQNCPFALTSPCSAIVCSPLVTPSPLFLLLQSVSAYPLLACRPRKLHEPLPFFMSGRPNPTFSYACPPSTAPTSLTLSCCLPYASHARCLHTVASTQGATFFGPPMTGQASLQ